MLLFFHANNYSHKIKESYHFQITFFGTSQHHHHQQQQEEEEQQQQKTKHPLL